MGIFSDDEEKKKNDSDSDLMAAFAIGAIIGAGLLSYLIDSFLSTPRGQTFMGGGLTSTGLKMIRDNWNKQE